MFGRKSRSSAWNKHSWRSPTLIVGELRQAIPQTLVEVAAHARLIGQRQGEQRAAGYHPRLERRTPGTGPSSARWPRRREEELISPSRKGRKGRPWTIKALLFFFLLFMLFVAHVDGRAEQVQSAIYYQAGSRAMINGVR